VRRRFGLPLAASIAGHICVLALLILFAGQVSRLSVPEPTRGIEIIMAPSEPISEPPPVAERPPILEPPPPPTPPPVVEPPPPESPPPPVRKPAVKPPVRQPARQPLPAAAPPPAPAQTAAVPRAVAPPSPVVSASYRALLSAWLESHKHYPDSARERGEEGRAVLRFRIDRSGRLLNYAVVQSTGHPDLDAAIDQMMRGASLPPFPAAMTATDIEVTVPVNFALAR
jgi:protein TonB